MKIERATRDDVRFVAQNMRERDFHEFSAISTHKNRQELADHMAVVYGDRDDVICATADEPICIGATILAWPNVMTLGFWATDRFPEIGLQITRFTKDLLARYEKAGVHRIQAISISNYEDAHRWLEVLGLKREALLEGYGRRGEDFIQFSRHSDVHQTGT